ncbi:MAG: ABC transporter ATP-binding protein [Chloroflexi bacterium RBG_16_48_8]|nr:MAG: ABC transporter ATP-binding protein [Chloroflexi bacterium RBG_16_48_8]
MLRVEDLHVRYGAIAALRGVSLTVQQGELVALIGVNGAGKTTTLSAISGVLKPASGLITFRDQTLIGKSPEIILRMGIAMVPEGRDIFPSLTVEENLRLGAFSRRNRAEYRNDLKEIFALFPILEERLHQMGGTLSGGEQQQLAIARSLMAHPQLLMLDEPSLGLAPTLVEQIFKLIATLQARGVTILLVEQNVDRTLEIADRVYLLNTGRVELEGSPEQLKSKASIREVYLGEG